MKIVKVVSEVSERVTVEGSNRVFYRTRKGRWYVLDKGRPRQTNLAGELEAAYRKWEKSQTREDPPSGLE